MPRKRSGSCNASLARNGCMEILGLRKDSNVVSIGVPSPRQFRKDSNGRVMRKHQDAKKHNKSNENHSTSEYSRTNTRSVRSSLSCLSQVESSVTATRTNTCSRSEYKDRSVPRHHKSVHDNRIESVKPKGRDSRSKGKARLLANATDSIELARKSLKLKNCSEAFKENRRNAELLRCEQKRPSKKSSQTSKSRAVVKKSQSQSTLISKTIGQSSLTRLGADKYVIRGKVCACLLFKAEVGESPDVKVAKDGKKEKKGNFDTKDAKDTRHKTGEKNTKKDKRKSGQKIQEKRTKHRG